ncbi:uncharacterized protein LOC113755447 [Coffea eugenioides]|uniref:uncharacterized protein LOC113755447 n=1 Tax=Coffea eugenioides TaxID=49369 RepID=UPI000F608A67|nr:uncharacterized protein LOC113755447 [Coffea eugenioides]
MTKNQDETLRRDVVELGSVVRTFTNKNKGMEQAIRTMEFRQDATEKLLKGLDQKYERMMNMMAQLMAKVSDHEKVVEGSSISNGEARPNESRMESQKEAVSKREARTSGRLPKMDLPIFYGDNPREWIRKANKYFKIHEIERDMKAEVAELYFRDRADIWFQGVFHGRETIPWSELSTALCIRFGEGSPEEAIEEFNKLVQSRSVAEYLEKFDMLKALVMPSLPRLSDSNYKACFMSGLKEKVVNMVKMSKPETLIAAIEMAKLQEKNLKAIQKMQKPVSTSFSNQRAPTEETEIIEEEVYCDCINGELADEHIETSIHALAGGTSHKTIKLKGLVKVRQVTALIDSGSTHSFLDEQRARKLKWGHQFQHTFNTLRLRGCDMILGVDWLANHSPIEFNFRELNMKIHQGKQEVVLKGKDISTMLRGLKRGKLAKWLRKQAYGVVAQLVAVEEEENPGQLPAKIRQVLDQYKDVFEEPKGMPPTRGHEHQIVLKEGANPFQVRPYRCPYVQKTEIERLVREMLELGIIQPSSSPFASPVLLVKKKDGSWRFCVDYRQLNELTVKNKFPMPLIEELIDELHGARYFTKIDLRASYFQIRVKVEDISKTAFRSHQGLYEFKVMPFGLTNAPATFQSLMNQVFQEQMRKHVLVFFDDILVYSPTLEEHVKHVKEVMSILRQHQLYAKMSKCSFAQLQVEYLGHIISAEGVQADPKKIECMENWPNPTNIKQLRGFLGLTDYYRRFVKGYGAIARPLTDLLKKDNFHWSEDLEQAFQKLKRAMCSTPVLAVPDFTQPFIIETDACYTGIGAVLMQNRRPISYLS